MTIGNVKNMPDLPHIDDVGIIMDNFVKYYGELYCNKPVNIHILDRMIEPSLVQWLVTLPTTLEAQV